MTYTSPEDVCFDDQFKLNRVKFSLKTQFKHISFLLFWENKKLSNELILLRFFITAKMELSFDHH